MAYHEAFSAEATVEDFKAHSATKEPGMLDQSGRWSEPGPAAAQAPGVDRCNRNSLGAAMPCGFGASLIRDAPR
jgi:hypothetical protein